MDFSKMYNLEGQVAVVVGGARDLGFDMAAILADAGCDLVITSRSRQRAVEAAAKLGAQYGREVLADELDICDHARVNALAKKVRDWKGRVDILINNAGIMIDDDIESLDVASVRLQFEVNALGPLNIALAFRKRLRRNSKLVNISSRLGSVGDNESGGDFGYRMSKAAQNMLTSNLAIDLGDEGIVVVAAHPGIVASNMTGGKGIPSNEVARDLRATIEQLSAEATGRFIDRFGKELPW